MEQIDGEAKPLAREDYDRIVERNIFDSQHIQDTTTAEADETESEEPVDLSGEAVATSLSVKLVSTFSVGDGTDPRSSCVISKGGRGDEDVYTVGDEKQFAPDTKVVRILYDRVEFVNKGRLEYVELEDFAKGVTMNVPPKEEATGEQTPSAEEGEEETKIEKTGSGTFVIDRAEIDEALANLDKLYTEIRAVPHFKEGRPNGLKLLSVRSGSIFSKLGLRRGDILQKINGLDLDIKRGLEIFNQLKSESRITIDLERRGSTQTMDYEIR